MDRAGTVARRRPGAARWPARRTAGGRGAHGHRHLRWPVATFAAVEIAGLITYLVLGRTLWFYSDEWDFVVDRHLSDPGGLFVSYNGHWMTLPIVVYRLLLQVTGLRTYLPYLVIVVVLHLLACALLYTVMLRAGVRAWLATILASTLVFLGFAAENIVFAIQMSWLGSITLGLTQLLIVIGGFTWRRGVLVAILGVAALMCSNLGIVTAVVVAAETLLRHGWRRAAAISAPAAAAFVTWWLVDGAQAHGSGAGAILHFAWHGVRSAGADFSRHGDAGLALLLVVLAVGLVRAARDRPHWYRIVAPLALGIVTFLVTTGSQRASAFGTDSAAAPRYVGITVMLAMPIAAVAVDALWTRWKPVGALALVALLIGVPGNLSALSGISDRAAHITAVRRLIVGLTQLPESRTVPADLRPFPESYLAPMLTVGYVRHAVADGTLPAHRVGVGERTAHGPVPARRLPDPRAGSRHGVRRDPLAGDRAGAPRPAAAFRRRLRHRDR